MVEQKNKDIEKQLQVFGFGKIQDFITMLDVMEHNNITIQDIRNYINHVSEMTAKEVAKLKQRQKIWEEKAKKCPECHVLMQLMSIENNSSIWACKKCRFSIYNEQSAEEILKELGVKV